MRSGDRVAHPKEVILFIVGGVTYSEAAAVAAYNVKRPDCRVVLGGTCIHNSERWPTQLLVVFCTAA